MCLQCIGGTEKIGISWETKLHCTWGTDKTGISWETKTSVHKGYRENGHFLGN